ncbi:MAG: hypothetical protein H7329_06980 [Opitutaceae bacterium]|nr:hypothetical protein [Cytophagales bacterium]
MNKLNLFTFAILICLINRSYSQSLIAGIPSADVAPEKRFMFTHESQINSWSYDKMKWNSFNFMCYGAAKNLEVTVSFANISNSPLSHESLGLGFKKIIDLKSVPLPEMKFVFGQNVLFSSDRKSVGGWSYAMFSNKLDRTKTRLTYGLSYGSAELFGYDTLSTTQNGITERKVTERNPFSFMGGVEQPIYKDKFLIIADWFSGTHDLGALISAIQLNFKHIVLIGGYKFPNLEAAKKGSVIMEIMYEF